MRSSREGPSSPLLQSVARLLPDGAWLPVPRGPLRGCRWLVGAGDPSCWTGEYGVHEQAYARNVVSAGDVVYDVGAGAGYFTLLFSRLVEATGRVISFEPAPGNLAHLQEHLRLNRRDNVSVREAAVSDFLGEGALRLLDGKKGGGRLAAGDGDLMVDVTTLDEVASKEGRSPSFIRIDTPGTERAVLEGAKSLLSDHHPGVLFTCESENAVRGCRSLLHDEGYQLRPLGPSGEAAGWEFAAEPPGE